MYQVISKGALLCCALGLSISVSAQEPVASFPSESSQIRLRYENFDPLAGLPVVPPALLSEESRLWIVQFDGTPTQAGRDSITQFGAEVHGYLPDNSYVVRMPENAVAAVSAQPAVRWVGRYHAAYRLDPALIALLAQSELDAAPYNMVVVDKHSDKPALAANIRALGGVVENEHQGSLLFTATLTGAQLIKTANLDEVLWIDAWTPIEEDVDNARIQGGANYVESQAGYSGATLNLHIYEGIDANHQAFSGPVINVRSSGASSGHGTNTAGIVFGDGTGNPQFRGFAPDCGKFYTNNNSVQGSRWQVCSDLINIHDVSHTTASWGNARTRFYTSVSADADDIIFDHDIAWTQSQSNAGNQDSRPQAWAKNIFSIGGVRHGNNSNPLDDTWSNSGSTGPAADGRIKPTLSAYYDQIGTTSQGGGYTTSFGGTSGATPIIAGHNALAIEMFTDDTSTPGVGPFGNPMRSPGMGTHENRPHFTTLKAMQVGAARQYALPSNDNSRMHVGWGFPNLQTMWDLRDKTIVVDETDVLTQGGMTRWDSNVGPNEPAFSAVLHYAEPAANPSASITLINNLSLKVTDPNGTIYWGNNGLTQNNWSTSGGTEDTINPIECVFVQNPIPGTWHVDVIATSIVADNHVETPLVDADYGLYVTGGTGQPSTSAYFVKYGQPCPGSTSTTTPCTQLNPTGGQLAGTISPLEYGFVVGASGLTQITTFDVYTRSTGGTQTIPAHIYTALGTTPLASTTISVGPTPGFYRATFAAPVTVTTTYFIAVDLSAGTVVVPNLTSGATGVAFTRSGAGSWNFAPSTNRPSWSVGCVAGTVFDIPSLSNVGNPVLGTTYDVTLSDALASTGAFHMTGLSDSVYNSTPLPAPLPNAPGCDLLVAPDATRLVFTDASGAASDSVSLPSSTSYIGLELFHQWAVLDPANALGIVVSDAGKARLGT